MKSKTAHTAVTPPKPQTKTYKTIKSFSFPSKNPPLCFKNTPTFFCSKRVAIKFPTMKQNIPEEKHTKKINQKKIL